MPPGARRLAMRILDELEGNTVHLDALADRHLRGQDLDIRDRRLVFELAYGIVRRKLTLNFIIEQFLEEPRLADNDMLMRLLRLGAYQIIYMDRIPEHAAVNETIKLAKIHRETERFSGLINAVLRAIIANKRKLPQPPPGAPLADRLAIEFSHPQWMVQRFLDRFGLGKTRTLLSFNNEKPDIFIRRTIKGMPRSQFEADVRTLADGPTGYLNLFYKLTQSFMAQSMPLFKEGYCTVQAPSSGWVTAMMDIQQGDKILDICSAPGGKATLMAELAGEHGSVCACDRNPRRLRDVVSTIRRMRINTIVPLACDGTAMPFTGKFDKVLLDAPCTASGVLHRHPEARWQKSLEDMERLTAVQARLLDAASQLVAPGGTLVYATCSLESEENEEQIRRFCSAHSEFAIERAPDAIPAQFVDDNGYLFITPFEHQLDGMFAARLRRKK